eukprot:Pgem_evm1s5164
MQCYEIKPNLVRSNSVDIQKLQKEFSTPSIFSNVVHLDFDPDDLGLGPSLVKCPSCNNVTTTITKYKIGKMTFLTSCLMCFIPCFWLGCCFLPFMVDKGKDVQHKCGFCGSKIGT